MPNYHVRTEIREPGAIGVFEWVGMYTQARDEDDARELNQAYWHAGPPGMAKETRGVTVQPLAENWQPCCKQS